MIKIAIFGGGIGGLTVANELSKFNSYDIAIYEKKNQIGGLARSMRDEDGCCSEISWRVFFDFYHNLFKTMKEIPTNDKNSTLDNLTIYRHTNVDDNSTIKDKVFGLKEIFKGLTSCDQRLDQLDSITWYEALGQTSDSNIFREIGGWLGMDRMKGSFKSVIKVGFEMNLLPKRLNSNYNDWVTTMPTSEALFDPWKKHLENKGVKIKFNEELSKINIINNEIKQCKLKSGKIVIADYYILALPVESLDSLIKTNYSLQKGQLKLISSLKENSLHIQLSFQVYFNRKVSLGIIDSVSNNGILLVNSPWDLIILQYDQIYKVPLCKNIPNAKGGWSITVCTAYTEGIKHKKPFNKCTYEECIEEIWAQIMQSTELREKVKKYNQFELNDKIIVKWTNYWPGYYFNTQTKQLETSEPKFTNNAGTYKLRPSFRTFIPNLFISTAYTKETIDIFSMEAASISGKLCANSIDKRSPKPIMQNRPTYLEPFRKIDSLAYKMGLPNMNLLFIVLVILLVIFFIVKMIL